MLIVFSPPYYLFARRDNNRIDVNRDGQIEEMHTACLLLRNHIVI